MAPHHTFPRVLRFPNAEELAREAGGRILDAAFHAVRGHGAFSLALAGGASPRRTYNDLATPPLSRRMPWNRTHVFWTDERMVPPGHPEGNYSMAREALLSKVSLPDANIHRIRGEMGDPREAALRYEEEILGFFGGVPAAFDLVLLGVGPDGHTASLFPGSPLLSETARLAAATGPLGAPPLPRVTLTLPALRSAREAMVLVEDPGALKGSVLEAALGDPGGSGASLPIVLATVPEKTLWLVEDRTWKETFGP